VTTCSCTQSSFYWAATTYGDGPGYAWDINFLTGLVDYSTKSYNSYVRAVRGGS
jgi:hypothetical protein